MSKTDSEFTKLAIKFVLGIVIGFALVLIGIVFFMIAILSVGVEGYHTPSWIWFVGAFSAEFIGISMMYLTMRGSPEPGTFSNTGKYQAKDKFF